jgi:HprK-related kinase A
VKVAELGPRQLDQLLTGPGLRLRTGPLVSCIRSPLPAVCEGLALHYAAHLVEEETGFADFHIGIDRPRGLRRWFNPQVIFSLDGQSPFTPLPGDQGFPMLEWAMNYCVSNLAHQFLILHAAVLERGGRALILPAPSGSGKSTLCAGLVFRGWRLLSDELAVIDPGSGQVVPLPRPVSLKNASIDVIRGFAPEVPFGPIVHETTKGSVGHFRPPADAVARADERALPGWVVLPRFEAGAPTRLEPLSKGRTLMRLVECAFNYNIYGREGFEMLADLVEHSDCFEFSYSRLDEATEEFSQLAGSHQGS